MCSHDQVLDSQLTLHRQHNVVPQLDLVKNVSHVALAFMRAEVFNQPSPSEWPLFTTIEKVRRQFSPGTAIMVAIGGWGDTVAFSQAAASEASRYLFSQNVNAMIQATGADGVDIDWEYPGGNGEDYKIVPNAQKEWEIAAYPQLLSAIRRAIGPSKLMSAAVPGLRRDMLAFNRETIPSISESLDFFNIMTYDLFNRRDNVTKHHTGIELSMDAVNAYLEAGVSPQAANMGFAFYVKWYRTAVDGGCDYKPIGCKTTLMEDPETGSDLGQAGAFSWHDAVPTELKASLSRALEHGQYDPHGGGHHFWDKEENLWWSWDTPSAVLKKFPEIINKMGLGGVFAWGLGEDAPKFEHLTALNDGVQAHWSEEKHSYKYEL